MAGLAGRARGESLVMHTQRRMQVNRLVEMNASGSYLSGRMALSARGGVIYCLGCQQRGTQSAFGPTASLIVTRRKLCCGPTLAAHQAGILE